MLVLSRKKGERVVLIHGSMRITVTMVEMGKQQVKLGFEAPSLVRIHREEVQLRIDAEAKEAAC